MAKEILLSEEVPTLMGPYWQAMMTMGEKFVFISGQVPEDAQDNLIG